MSETMSAERPQQDLPIFLQNEKRGLLTIEDGRLDVLQFSSKSTNARPPKRLLSCPVRNLLLVKLSSSTPTTSDHRRLDIHCLIQKDNDFRLSKMHVLVESKNVEVAQSWINTAMIAAYAQVRPYRRVLVLVNPIGGKGKARSVTKSHVVPLLEAAGCILDVRETTHAQHAEEIAREVELNYDVIATASGDGLIYEVINGFAVRPDALQALRIPIAPIPLGSANSLSLNIFGPKNAFNVSLACLNIIKGDPMPINLCSILFLQSLKSRWFFCSVAMGMMVDVDIGTENLRWMGDTRFFVGFLKGIVQSPLMKCRIKMKLVESDKVEMARKAREKVHAQGERVERIHEAAENGVPPQEQEESQAREGVSSNDDANGHKHPNGNGKGKEETNRFSEGPLSKPEKVEIDDTWVMLESLKKGTISSQPRGNDGDGAGTEALKGGWRDGDAMLYVYAGTMPWADRDLMQWPVATAGSGVIDLVVQRIVPRSTFLNSLSAGANGELFWIDSVHYYKVSAFEVENLDPDRQKIISIDGEQFPFEDFQLQVKPKMINTLSLEGRYFVSDFLKKHHQKE